LVGDSKGRGGCFVFGLIAFAGVLILYSLLLVMGYGLSESTQLGPLLSVVVPCLGLAVAMLVLAAWVYRHNPSPRSQPDA
jgi:peptidoglycan/LPS O-acetylase OafA/YrhL